MKTTSERLFNEVEKLWTELNLFKTPYFLSLTDGSMSKREFIKSQKAFHLAVSYFSKPMLILASRIHSSHTRLQIIENIYEEHGEMNENEFHENTFQEWLHRLEPDHKDAEEIPNNLPSSAFNAALTGTCFSDSVEKGACCLGVIEFMFFHISKFIADAVVYRGWLSKDQLIHYNLHADLDMKHSKDLLEVVDKLPVHHINDCLEGVKFGSFIFCRLYEDLYKCLSEKPAIMDKRV